MMPHDPTRLYIEHALLRILAELPPGFPAAPIIMVQSLRDTTATLRIGPANAFEVAGDDRPMTEAERETFEAVSAETDRLGRKVTGAEIRAALTAAGTRWGMSTINRCLADLVAKGHLLNSRNRQGYAIKTDRD
jgi:hypothetical protein